jgi:DNA helicase II / ATP-dependent DNA helicase PcrA
MNTLNAPQQRAVEHLSGPLLVFAGAGSGKTSTITRRIAHLVNSGVDPSDILAVTFTNKAAGEMEERLVKLIGEEAVSTLWLGTFHATGARILRALAVFTGRRADFSIYDDHDQLTVVKQVMNELGVDQKFYKPNEVRDRICKAKEKALFPEHLKTSEERMDRDLADIWLRYEAWLEASNAFDFEDLLLWPMRLAEENSEAGHRLKNRFQHVLVDEFQDTSHTQWRFVKAMSETSGNIMVVGDDDQCIYEWRSADVNIIRGFADVLPNTTVVKLEQNYRSTGNIVAAALDVIKTSKTRVDKRLWTEAEAGSPVRVVQVPNDREEGWLIARELKKQGTDGAAVLYRTHQIARVIEEALIEDGIPYVVLGGPRFYDRKEVRDVLAYLRLVQSPESNVDLLRAINVPSRGIGAAKVARLQEIAKSSGESLWKATAELAGSGELRPKEQEGLRRFRELVYSAMSAKLSGQGPGRIAKLVIEESGYLDMWNEEALELKKAGKAAEAEVAVERGKNVVEILSAVSSYEDDAKEAGKKPSLEGYLERVALMTSSDKKHPEGAVVLMTIHAAKGLEFDRVYVAACEEGNLPLESGRGDQNIDEERRLMYVAITRARRELTLSWSETRYFRGKLVPNRMSRFLEAISPNVSTDHYVDGNLHEAKRGK